MGDNEKKKKRYCSVPECKCNDSEPLIFHRFPRDEEIKVSWKNACRIAKDISVHMFVCSKHFRQEDYVSDQDAKVQRLKKGTIPSQNLPKELPKLIRCELPTIAGVKRKRTNDETIIPFQNEIDNILNTIDDEKIEEIQTTLISPEIGVKRKCYVPECTTTPNDNRFYHYFPKNKKIRQQWVNICEIEESVKPYMTVCSAHFRTNDYLISPESNRPMLKPQAVPTSNAYKSCEIESENTNDNPFVQNSKIITQENANTIIYTANNANDLINFIENYNENSDDYLKDSGIITKELDNVGDFDLPEDDLDLFEDQDEALNDSQNDCSVETDNVVDDINLNFSKNDSDAKSPGDNSNSKLSTNNNLADESKTGEMIVEEHDNVNAIIERNENENVIIQEKNARERKGKNSSSNVTLKRSIVITSLCSECGQQCKIENEYDCLDGVIKNWETLAVRILFELQDIVPANEDDYLIFMKIGLQICDKVLQKEKVYLMNLLTNDNELKAFTGINFEFLDKLTKLVTLYEGSNYTFKYFDCARDRIVMCLCKIRTDLSLCCLAKLFGVRQQVFLNYFTTMIRTLSVLLEKTIYWQRAEELMKSLPANLQAFKQTKVLLSCNEMLIERQKCQRCRLDAELGSRKFESVKLMLGVSLTGLIIFKSDVFKGQKSGGSIFRHTNILGHLDPTREAIMTDDSLDIETECAERNINLIKLPKIERNCNISSNELEFVKNVFTANFLIERTLQRFKTFKIVQHKISWRTLPYLNDICTIIAGVVNMNNVIPPDEARLQLSFLR